MQKIIYNGLEFERSSRTGYIITGFKPNDIDIERDTEKVVGVDGETVLNALYSPRICKLTGYIYSKNKSNLQALRRKLLRKCSGKGEHVMIYYIGPDDDYNVYYANAIADVTECDIFGRNIYSFAVEFTLPEFYFISAEQENALEVSGESIVYNSITTATDAQTPAKIILEASDTNNISSSDRSKIFGLALNSSMAVTDAVSININDKLLRMSYALQEKETVTIENLRAESSIYGDVTQYINLESKNLYLEQNNSIVVSSDFTQAADVLSAGRDFSFGAKIKYCERYIGV